MTDRNGSTNADSRTPTPPGGDQRGEAPQYRSLASGGKRRHPARGVLPFVFLAGIALLIARQEVPAVGDWWERTFFAADWKARNTCRAAVLADVKQGHYARILRSGKVHRTADGPYIDRLRVAVLDESGAEQILEYRCYLDSDGQLFKLVGKPQGKPTCP